MARGKIDKRKKGLRALIPIAVIVCEGEKTEVNYLINFKRRRGIKLEVLHPGYTDAAGIVKYGLKMFERYDLSLQNKDTVHAVFDCDENKQEQLDKAKFLASKKINLVFSNPCFELWFLLHFIDLSNPITRYDVIQKSGSYLNAYSKSKDYYYAIKSYFLVFLARK